MGAGPVHVIGFGQWDVSEMHLHGDALVIAMRRTGPGDFLVPGGGVDQSQPSFPKHLQLKVVTLANSRPVSMRMKSYCSYATEFGGCSLYINS